MADDQSHASSEIGQNLSCLARAEGPGEEIKLARALNLLVEACYRQGDRDASTLELATEALGLFQSRPESDARHRAHALLNRGRLLTDGEDKDFKQAFHDLTESYRLIISEDGRHALRLSVVLNALSELFGESPWAEERARSLEWFVALQPPRARLVGPLAEVLEFFKQELVEERLPASGLSSVPDSPALAAALLSVQLLRSYDTDRRPESKYLANAYNAASNILERQQRYPEALVAAREALSIRRAIYPAGHPRIARSHHNLGEILYYLGRVDSAALELQTGYELRQQRVDFLRAEARCAVDSRSKPEAICSPIGSRQERGECQVSLAAHDVEAFPGGFPSPYLCAELELGKELDKCDRFLASSRLAIGRLALSTGDLPEAIDLLGKAYLSTRLIYGDGSRVAEVLAELSSAYELTGNFDLADCFLAKAVLASEGNQQGWLSRLSVARAGLQVQLGGAAKAIEVLEAASRDAGLNAEDRAMTKRTLARAHLENGELKQARLLLAESAAALTNTYRRHSGLLPVLLDLAKAELDQQLTAQAEATLASIRAEMDSLGIEVFAAEPRYELLQARLMVQRGRRSRAFDHAVSSARSWQREIRPVLKVLPEEAAIRFVRLHSQSLALLFSLLNEHASEEQLALAWEVILASRGQVLDEIRSRLDFGVLSADPRLAELENLSAVYARLLVQELRSEPGTVRRGAVQSAKTRLEAARRAHAERTARLRDDSRERVRTVVELRGFVPEDAALVSFVRVPGVADQASSESRYKAFILRDDEPIGFVDLGSAEEIDSLISRWRETLVAGLVGADHGMRRVNEVASALGQRVWNPLLPHLGASRRIFLCADGAILLLSFAALPSTEGTFLAEDGYEFHNLVVENDLVEFSRAVATFGGRMLAMTPSFSVIGSGVNLSPGTSAQWPADWIEKAISMVTDAAAQIRFRSVLDPCLGRRFVPFPPIAGARDEVVAIQGILKQAQVGLSRGETRPSLDWIDGSEATEAVFKRKAGRYDYIHLATHGFYQKRCSPQLLPESSAYPTGRQAISGLAFSGANWEDTTEDENLADGILLDHEVATMDLAKARWVVLSACETGLGEVAAGEGLLGLARSFRAAGAQTLILSLWPVDDDSTQLWMSELYRAHFLQQRSTVSAVSHAHLARIRALRREGREPHPGLWAGFTSTGAWR